MPLPFIPLKILEVKPMAELNSKIFYMNIKYENTNRRKKELVKKFLKMVCRNV
jgi:hypothetical protein